MLKVMDLEDELKEIGENMKALEVAEEKALIREEKYLVQYKYFLTCLFWNNFVSGADFGFDGEAKDCWPETGIWREEYQQTKP